MFVDETGCNFCGILIEVNAKNDRLIRPYVGYSEIFVFSSSVQFFEAYTQSDTEYKVVRFRSSANLRRTDFSGAVNSRLPIFV